MRKIDVKDKLGELGVTVAGISLGEFDIIGEMTAKKMRHPRDPNFARFGAFFRPNYERGILIYHLIRTKSLRSILEIGFGRGYAAICAAKAFHDAGIRDGRVISVDPTPAGCDTDEKWSAYSEMLFSAVPWAKSYIDVKIGMSVDVVPRIDCPWDMVYIDGDHSYGGTKTDWELVKDKWNSFVLFDDYHMRSKHEPGIQCSELIDQIEPDGFSKELIVTDRRIFVDDRSIADADIDYGQVLLTKSHQ